MDGDTDATTTGPRRVRVAEAAEALGISAEAVRMRVRRGTLRSERRDRVRSLEGQLEGEREANRENRRIIAALTSRIPELPTPPMFLESPSEATGEPQPGRVSLSHP